MAAEPATSRYGYTFVRCCACRSAFVHPLPSTETLAAHYQAPGYFEGDEERGYRHYADMQKALTPHFQRRLRIITRQVGQPGRLLDFGCAAGYFLEIARAQGWQVAGIEIAQEMAREASRRLGLPIATSLSELSGDPFDAVTLWDVVEHLPDPVAGLEQLRNRLRPGGVLTLSTPNAGHWQALRETETWIHYRPPSHLVLFTDEGIARTLERAGFERVTVQKISPLPPLPGWLRRMSAPLERSLASGQARAWLVARSAWFAVRIVGRGWQKLAHPADDICAALEATAFRPGG
jgi:SAM-dependent methyltransferase